MLPRFYLPALSVLWTAEPFLPKPLPAAWNAPTPLAPRPVKPNCASDAEPSVFFAVFLLLELSRPRYYYIVLSLVLWVPLLFGCLSVPIAAFKVLRDSIDLLAFVTVLL